MKNTEIKTIWQDYARLMGQKLMTQGWIKTTRTSKNVVFIELSDGTCFKSLQVVFDKQLSNYDEAASFTIGSAISVEGEIITSLGAGQPFELKADKIILLGSSDPDFPMQKKGHSFEFLRTVAHLRPRANVFRAVFRVRSLLSFAIHQFFIERGFVYVQTPIISSSDAEGAGEVFTVTNMDLANIPTTKEGVDYSQDFFSTKTGLAVSGQLQAEAFALAFSKVYTFGPTFRAENSNTKRHLAEFWMIEPEIAFADLADDMALAEDMIKYIIKYVLDNAPDELQFLNEMVDKTLLAKLTDLVKSEFNHLTYTEAIDQLQTANIKFEYPVAWGKDLQTEHEKYLAETIFNGPVFVTDYPKDFKAFYMRQNDDGKTVAAMDLLVPGVGEIIGGSQREERLDNLTRRMAEMKLSSDDYWWYLELRKYGGVPHAGFGLGFERLVTYVTGLDNIRDVIPFPRTPGNAEF